MATVHHDARKCQSMGVCESLAPAVFSFNDKNELVVTTGGEVPESELENVREAVLGCPNEALRLEE